MIPATSNSPTHSRVTNEPKATQGCLKKDHAPSINSLAVEVRKPDQKVSIEPHTRAAKKEVKERKLMPANVGSYVLAANHALQTVAQGQLDPELKACLIRYVETLAQNEPVPLADHKTLFNYFRRPLPGMDIACLDAEDLEHLCKQGFSLNKIPAHRLTGNLCRLACASYPRNLQHVPLELKDSSICKIACTQESRMISHVPEHILSSWHSSGFLEKLFARNMYIFSLIPDRYITYPMLVAACKKGIHAYQRLSEDHPKRDELLKIAFEHNPRTLEDFPVAMKTRDVCRSACERDGYCFKYVPEQYRTFELFNIACKTSPCPLDELPPTLTDKERYPFYYTACTNTAMALLYIPEASKQYELCMLACQNPDIEYCFDALPEHLSEEEITELYRIAFKSSKGQFLHHLCKPMIKAHSHLYHDACNFWESVIKKDSMAYYNIPDEFRTTDHLNLALKAELSPKFIDTISDIEHLSRLPYIPLPNQFKFLGDPEKSANEKLRLIELIDGANHQLCKPVSERSLITTASPLHFEIRNPFLMDLTLAAYESVHFELENLWQGEQIHRYVNTHTPDFPVTDVPEPLLARNNRYQQTVGGRTIQFKGQNTCENSLYFKFQRAGERLQDLAREGLMYQYLDHHPDIRMQFKSTLPSLHGFMKIPLDEHLATILKTFPDPVAIIEENGHPFVHVFSYTAPSNYSNYAYVADDDMDNPCKKPEQGIFTALFDIGRLFSMGLILTNILPAYHDTGSTRRWVALHNVFNLRDGVYPGTFRAWNTDATDKPDIGYSGVRDVGDYEFFGQIQSCLNQQDTQDCIHTQPVLQRLALANAGIEIILAAVLLRSRLRQQFEDYHYQNPEAVMQTACFIESACNQWLAGLNTSICPVEPSNNLLKEMLQYPEEEYQQWLHRAAQEVVYWTALQPGEEHYEAFQHGLFDHSQCYLNHINQGKLSPELYPEDKAVKKNETDFYNLNGRLNLGAHNATFPFISLMNGLTRMVTGVLMTDGGRTP